MSESADYPIKLRLWNALGKTDPKMTKKFTRSGGFSGTAIKPMCSSLGNGFSMSFLRKIKMDSNGCWLWIGAINNKGYGRMRVAGKSVFAHRFAYETAFRPIPSGLQIDHLCRVRNCVNPDHLEPVTPRENHLRGISPILASLRGRVKTHCKRGHYFDLKNTRITPDGRRNCRACMNEYMRQRRADGKSK